jgi:hypothetical protein
MKQQTPIEYLRTKLLEDTHLTAFDIFDIAREMEKEQLKQKFIEGMEHKRKMNKNRNWYNNFLKHKQ